VTLLEWLLRLSAVAQLGVAAVNFFTARLLKWQEPIDRMPLLLRQVFWVHAWFVSFVLALFAVLTWRFAPEMAGGSDAACGWLAAGIGLVWGLRTIAQVAYYSPSHWRGQGGRTAIHVFLFLVYGGMSGSYLLAAWRWFSRAAVGP
jgi:hypothetical protein